MRLLRPAGFEIIDARQDYPHIHAAQRARTSATITSLSKR